MSKHQETLGIHFNTAGDKTSFTASLNRGTKIATHGPQSPVYANHPDVKAAVDTIAVDTISLKTSVDGWNTAEAGVKKARTALGLAMQTWNGSYDVLVAAGQKRCATIDDGTSLGMDVRTVTHNPLALPISVELKQDFKKNLLRVHVHRAPGMDVVDVEISADPITATSWKLQDGSGARHAIANPAKGTWWVRAASRTAKGKSDYTTPVSIVIT